MIRQKLHVRDVDVFPQVVQLHAVAVVDVNRLLLRHGKVLIVVQPLDVPDCLAQLYLTTQLPLPPVKRRNVTLPAPYQQLPPVARVVAQVRTQPVEAQIEALLGRLNRDALGDLILPRLVRPLELALGLQEPGLVLVQDLGVLGLERRILVLLLQLSQRPPQLLVLDRPHVHARPAPVLPLRLLLPPLLGLVRLGGEGCARVPDRERPVGLLLESRDRARTFPF